MGLTPLTLERGTTGAVGMCPDLGDAEEQPAFVEAPEAAALVQGCTLCLLKPF